jgi:hypothetical protein
MRVVNKVRVRSNRWLCFAGIVCLSLIILAMPSYPVAQTDAAQAASPSDAYDYPIKGGTEEWKAFQTHDEMLRACQIPEDILKNMSTSGLVQTVLEYPLYGDMMAYNSIQQGFDAVASQFNGLPELLNRQDAGTELLAIYSKMNPQAIEENWGPIQRGACARSIADVEILLAQNRILDNLSRIQLQDLIAEARLKYTAKQQSATYGPTSQGYSVRLMGKALQRVDYLPFQRQIHEDPAIQSFLGSGFYATHIVSKIVSNTDQFLSGQ